MDVETDNLIEIPRFSHIVLLVMLRIDLNAKNRLCWDDQWIAVIVYQLMTSSVSNMANVFDCGFIDYPEGTARVLAAILYKARVYC